MIIYCFKCKHKTETLADIALKSSNGRKYDQRYLFRLVVLKIQFSYLRMQ